MPETKEKLEQEIGVATQEQGHRIEQRKQPEGLQDVRERQQIPHEIKSWMEKIEEDPQQQRMVSDDQGQPILSPTTKQNAKIVLPSTRSSFLDGFKKSFDEAGRWFSTFLLRLIKKNKGNVKFKEE